MSYLEKVLKTWLDVLVEIEHDTADVLIIDPWVVDLHRHLRTSRLHRDLKWCEKIQPFVNLDGVVNIHRS